MRRARRQDDTRAPEPARVPGLRAADILGQKIREGGGAARQGWHVMVGLQLPWPIASLNIWQRMHWTRRRKIGRAIAACIGVAGSGAASTPRHVAITRVGRRVLDHDNLVGG